MTGVVRPQYVGHHCPIEGTQALVRLSSIIEPTSDGGCYDGLSASQALNGFCAKSDGKDKLTALIQVPCSVPVSQPNFSAAADFGDLGL